MKQYFPTALLCIAMASTSWPLAAQELNVLDGFKPFRNPSKDVAVPRDLFDDLQVMLNVLDEGPEVTVVKGREICDDPRWQDARQRAQGKLFNAATVFGLVLRDSRNRNDRKLAAYGTFILDDPSHVCELIAFFPGEPLREIREPAMRRAAHFLQHYLPKRVAVLEGDDYTGVPDAQGLYRVDAAPYLSMLELDDYRDLAQALWFLRQLVEIAPNSAEAMLLYSRDRLPALLTHEQEVVRVEARQFLHAADPQKRAMPKQDASATDQLVWLDAVLYDVFPPIRAVSEGLTELYPSEDLDRIVKAGRDVLSRDAIGEPHQGQLPGGTYYRGFKVMRVPDVLKPLRIPVDAVITTVNGQSVTTGKSLLAAIELWIEAKHGVIVEYVHGGKQKVMEYRLR